MSLLKVSLDCILKEYFEKIGRALGTRPPMTKSNQFSIMKFFIKGFFSKYEEIIIEKLHLLRSESKVPKHHSSHPVNLKA